MNDLEELGSEELFLTSQYNIEIFSCCLLLLPFCCSTFHLTNAESSQICSKDHHSVSRIRSLHLLLEVILRVEEIRVMRNSDPRVRIVCVYRFRCNFHSRFTMYVAGCDFQLAFTRIQPFGLDDVSSLGKAYSRLVTDLCKL